MMKLVSILALAFAASAQADVQIGTYAGQLANGEACSFEIKEKIYADNLRHPLQERVTIEVLGAPVTLSHPASIDLASGKVGFTHDFLQATRGVAGASEAVVLVMDHSEGRDGPSELVLLRDYFAADRADMRWACTGLRFVGK